MVKRKPADCPGAFETPKGRARWTLRLLESNVVELNIEALVSSATTIILLSLHLSPAAEISAFNKFAHSAAAALSLASCVRVLHHSAAQHIASPTFRAWPQPLRHSNRDASESPNPCPFKLVAKRATRLAPLDREDRGHRARAGAHGRPCRGGPGAQRRRRPGRARRDRLASAGSRRGVQPSRD